MRRPGSEDPHRCQRKFNAISLMLSLILDLPASMTLANKVKLFNYNKIISTHNFLQPIQTLSLYDHISIPLILLQVFALYGTAHQKYKGNSRKYKGIGPLCHIFTFTSPRPPGSGWTALSIFVHTFGAPSALSIPVSASLPSPGP
jgi:hypothetical protein